MPKVDDTNQVPETLSAPWLKRFFKRKLGIVVRIRTLSGRAGYVDVWIPGSERFSAELGNRCMRVVYPNSETLREQSWGGNVRGQNIVITRGQWRLVLRSLIEEPVGIVI